MNGVRITINLVLAAGLFSLGVYLLMQDSLFLPDRWNPAVGTLFKGASLYWLAAAVLALAAFAGAVARSWITGVVALPPRGTVRPYRACQRAIIARFWYLIAIVLVAVVVAFALAEKVANPALVMT